jgi:dihydroxyacetone synthase
MAALQKLRFIGIATHDAIGIGEDGPTHQPIALAAFYRALPNLNFIRPADAEEVIGAWLLALKDTEHPTLLALSRQAVPLLEGTKREGVEKGGYVVYGDEKEQPDLVILATGAEVSRAVQAAEKLASDNKLKTRVVSMPSLQHFDVQPASYRRQVIPKGALVVALEAYASFGWARYAHAGCHMHSFGHSAPAPLLYEHFGFGVDNIASKVGKWVESRKAKDGSGWELPEVGDFDELLLGTIGH